MTNADPRGGARVSSEPVAPLPPVPLEQLASCVSGAQIQSPVDVAVTDVSFDSRRVSAGSLFFCVRGASADGHDFAADALARGAAALVVERWLDVEAPQINVRSVREAMGPMSATVFGHPAAAMRTVGITGTNGKTTITYLLGAIFEAAGMKPGVIGTTGAMIAGEPLDMERTTPEAPDLQRLLARMRDSGVQAAAIEVSSHALAQHRVDGISFDVAVFTNLSLDHLDYHGSMDDYFAAKARLFTREMAALGVVNADDPWGARLIADPSIAVRTFSTASSREGRVDIRAEDVSSTSAGISFSVDGLKVQPRLRGGFNVSNCLAAFAAGRALGIDDATIVSGIEALQGVPGRVEAVDAGQGFLVVVDYAHTPDSILGVLQAARPLASGRLIVVFGCGGDRDRDKRSQMGAAATGSADLSIITTDNPRSEDPLEIIAQIEPGALQGGGRFVIQPDRREAIRLALSEAGPGDVVVIAGKGHERYQEFAGRTIPFDDRDVAREELLAMGRTA
jgi:UDP-N-acetylmuramoyl-L-alanyl-D-glutamate--2,6-diaminopimelate ligase